jgi:ubiquinone/menaquinone biosynthesis C-methylase UbiE
MPTWDELFQQEEFRWREPHPAVVEFAKLLQARRLQRVLDLGCGTGRHLIYLAKEGCEVHGTDISQTGLTYARQWLSQEGLAAELKQSDMTAIPYPDGFFDAIISIFVIYHGTVEAMSRAIAEIYRVLRFGGLALLTFISTRSYRYGRGEEIEPGTFIPDEGVDAGVPHHYSDRGEVEDLLKKFAILKMELVERIDEQGRRHSHWEVVVEKI